MLKKWFIEKCCFTYYCTVQLYKIVLKAWKQSALEHLQHPVLRQPSTWDGRVGEAALLFVSTVELAAGEGFPLKQDLSPAGCSSVWSRSAAWTEAPTIGVSLSWGWCINKYKGRASFLCLLTHREEHSSDLCFHTGALAIPQMLFIKQAALGVTSGYSVPDSYSGGFFLFKMPDSNC